MKIGIISSAHMHIYSYAHALKEIKGVEIVGITDEVEKRGKAFAEQFNVGYYARYDELLKQPIDAVIVTSENANHKEHVLAAARAGKHILCEKPISASKEDAEEMIKVCREQGIILQIAFPVRFNASIIRAKQMIEQGKLGRILAMKGTNHGQNPGGWFIDPKLSGGGAVIDHTVHVVDIMRWFTGAEVKEVYAEVGSLFAADGIDDSGILSMEFDNGVFATLDCSWSRNKTFPTWGDVTLEIVGTEGTLSLDALNQKLNVYSNESGNRWDFWGENMDLGLVRDFVDCIHENRQPSITGEDGLRALEVALAAYESGKTNQPVVIR
jgi:UDP-N-acetylglucosamine 3-dehydrogenase